MVIETCAGPNFKRFRVVKFNLRKIRFVISKTNHEKLLRGYGKLNTRKLNTRKLNTENSTHSEKQKTQHKKTQHRKLNTKSQHI